MAKKNTTLTPLLVLIIISLVGVVGYVLLKDGEMSGEEVVTEGAEDVLLVEFEKRKGKVLTPDYIEPETLLAVSLGDVSGVSKSGGIEVPVYDGGVTTVAAMLPDKDFGLMDIVIGEEDPELSVQSTAEAMVFMAPHLTSPDPDLALEIMTIIKTDPAVTVFAQEIDRVLEEDKEPLQDPSALTAYGKAVESVLSTFNE